MAVYGDLLFLINFSMDFLCFYISCLLLHQRVPLLRACISSALGGAYSVFALFVNVNKSAALLIDLLALAVMCLIVYGKRGVSLFKILKRVFLYFFVSALLGGLMTSLFSLFNRVDMFDGNTDMGDGMDVWIFVLLVIVGSVITVSGGRIFRSSSSRRVVRLEIENDVGVASLRALVDSGNLASEPISGRSVVFASLESCKNIIGGSLYDYLKSNADFGDIPASVLQGIRIVPTQAISGRSCLPAMRFKRVRVIEGGQSKDVDVYVALVNTRIFDGYDAIISSEAII